MKDKETNRNICEQVVNAVVDKVERNQGVVIGTVSNSAHNLHSQTSKAPQHKIDTTDRRQIRAKNEDKSRTTKETLDDIKRIHLKEKKKKEQSNIEQYQLGIGSEAWVSKNFSFGILNPTLIY